MLSFLCENGTIEKEDKEFEKNESETVDTKVFNSFKRFLKWLERLEDIEEDQHFFFLKTEFRQSHFFHNQFSNTKIFLINFNPVKIIPKGCLLQILPKTTKNIFV